MRMRYPSRMNRGFAAGFFLALSLPVFPSVALAIDVIDSPDITKGEMDATYFGSRTFDRNHDKNDLQDSEATLEYSPTGYWHTEIGGFFSKTPDQSFQMDGVEWNNFFQFSEKGARWLDSGIEIALQQSTHDDLASSIGTKLLLEKDVGKFVNIANIGLTQEVGAHASGGPDRAFQWNTQYTLCDEFAPGFEVQSDFGKPNEGLGFNQGQHYIGPGIYGTFMDHFHYEAAYLAGVSSGASDSAVRFLFQYQTTY
jgi:hypothetical protein